MDFAQQAEELLSIWNETSPKKREALIEKLLAQEVVYVDPHVPAPVKGREGFAVFATRFQQMVQGVIVSLDGTAQTHNSFGRIGFKITRSDKPFSSGMFFVDLDQGGQMIRIVGFAD